jgi:hypothetical protein
LVPLLPVLHWWRLLSGSGESVKRTRTANISCQKIIIMSADSCIHIANLFYLGSYLCRDILWLRLWTCCGLVFGIIFFCVQTQAMFAPASWMGVFLLVNFVQIVRISRERRNLRLTPQQERVCAMMLDRVSRDEMLNILTKSICEGKAEPTLLERRDAIQLNSEEQLVKNLAFDRLSDGELVNLIVRRFWRSIGRRKGRWFRRALATKAGTANEAYIGESQPAFKQVSVPT